MYKSVIKRTIDFLLSLLILILLSPVLLIVALALSIENSGSPLFFQNRPGLYGKIFTLIKFKTMNDAVDEYGNMLPPSQRLTRLGKFVRSASLDELPQMINVLKGDISLIGPRPLRIEYLNHYSNYEMRRHEVLPGITGWAQINGRNQLSWDKRFEMDVWYVDNISLALDVKIFWLTIYKILKREGVNEQKKEIRKPFKNIKLNS